MNRILVCLSAMLLISLSFVASAGAAVFERDWKTPGDGLLTFDDVNLREWLDLSVSRLDQFPEVRLENAIAQLAPGGLFEGFTWAKRDDVVAFAQSAGINTSTGNFPVNEASTSSLIELLESTFQSSWLFHSTGFLDEIDGTHRMGADFYVQFNPFTGAGSTAGLQISSTNDFLRLPSTGLMLYRNIPEPATGVLAVAALTGILSISARSRN